MGSPLSPLLAELFMNNLEEKLFNSNNFLLNKVLYWYRYVDDVLVAWTGTERQLHLFHKLINQLHPKIKFTVELEENGSLNFLDINISKDNNKHKFKMFRKPTYTDSLIPFNSNHPWSYKLAAFQSMFHRLLSIPLSREDYNLELETIYRIGLNNGYPIFVLKNLYNKKLQQSILKQFYAVNNKNNDSDLKYIKMQFNNKISPKISKELEKLQYKPVYYCNTNIGKLLFNTKDKVEKLERSGVYRL